MLIFSGILIKAIPNLCSLLYKMGVLSPCALGNACKKCSIQIKCQWPHYNHCLLWGVLPHFCSGLSQLTLWDLGCNEKAVLAGQKRNYWYPFLSKAYADQMQLKNNYLFKWKLNKDISSFIYRLYGSIIVSPHSLDQHGKLSLHIYFSIEFVYLILYIPHIVFCMVNPKKKTQNNSLIIGKSFFMPNHKF